MPRKILLSAFLLFMGFTAARGQADRPPRLVVSIVVDQLRSDYLSTFTPFFTEGGFKRLLSMGTVYNSASYPFSPVDRSSAIAAVSTGVSPYYNGIVGQRWLNRETLRPVWCVADDRYGGLGTSESASPETMGTSTLGDELKVATAGKAQVWAVAPTSDAAILSAGHAADGVLWINDERGQWCTSRYYMKSLPEWAAVNRKSTADVNTDITDMAMKCIAANEMGYSTVSDLLCITYLAGRDEVNYSGDETYQMQNIYVRLDAEITRLVEMVERRFGADNTLFMLTSTGYSKEREESDYQKYRIPTGTFYMSRTADLLNMYLGAIWGQGKYVETTYRNHIFMDHALLDQKKISIANATGRAQELLVMMSGVRNVYTSLQLLTISNEQIQKVRQGYHPERCGDLVIETAPGWRVLTENTGESEYLRASFFQFPIIFYGAGTEALQVSGHVTVDRIAPTLARRMRIRAPNACSAEPLF